MTRKDYNVIAYRMAMAEPVNRNRMGHDAWNEACESLATGLMFTNLRFDSTRFINACKFEYWKNRVPPHKGPLD